jgi:hypothetical protein
VNRKYDEVDLLEAAAAALEASAAAGVAGNLGALLVHLPARLDGPDARVPARAGRAHPGRRVPGRPGRRRLS